MSRNGMSIGDLARTAGISTRAVRHYHAVGLLPEPERDSSGYRRYDAKDVIALVRIVRLRNVGMPIPKIAEQLGTENGSDGPLSATLHALATELDAEIADLAATRDRLLALAQDEAFEQPAKSLADALRVHGVLGPADDLRAGEEWAASLLDALHPQGMPGVLDQARALLDDPAAGARLTALWGRFRGLRRKTPEADIAALAAEVAAALPRTDEVNPFVDIELMDQLLGDRLNRAQQDFVHRLRDLVATNRSENR